MKSPFPGMDPFLESPDEFPDFHDSFIIHLKETLQVQLPPPYFAKTGRRVWVEASERPIEPDVGTYRRGNGPPSPAAPGATATLTPARTVIVEVMHDEEREPFVEIYRKEGGGARLVCSLEVLSPSNKTPGEAAQGLYLQKQLEVLASQVHLVEIDLLRGGRHTTAVPLHSMLAKTGPLDYHVCVHRWDRFKEYVIYPILLNQPLPAITVPLLGSDQVSVNLQEVFQLTYNLGGYDRSLDYRLESLKLPLRAELIPWVQEVLKQR